MKALITFFIAFTLSTPSFAQSSKITSSEFDKSNAYSSNVDLGIHNTNHYYLRKPLGTGDSKIVIVQNDIKIKSSSEIQLPKSKDLIEEVYLINGQLYIFFSYHLSKKHTLYAAKLSENGTFSTEPKEVYVIADCGPTSVEKGSYRISYSEDRKTFLIQVRHHKAEDIYYKLFDLSFNETNSFIYKHNSPDKNLSSIQSYLDESGNVHSIVFVGPKKNKEKRYEYSFCSYNVADKKWKNHPI